jgi:acetyl-CoA carboxylase biotin carboxylase subunit
MITGPPHPAPKGSGPVVPEVQLRFVRKVLVANRGEIAVRVIRAARESGLQSVAVFADCDRGARHMRMADEAWPLGGNAPGESYLRIDKIVDAARASGADAVHPGYGFLAENPEFADACESAGLTFIGPSATAIRRMGSKTAAREVAVACGVPVVPGTAAPIPAGAPEADVLREAERIGYPLMLKAVAGGGGKGMRVVSRPEDLHGALRAARSEAQTAFGNGAVFVERRLGRPRHIEIQLLGDRHGTVVPFVERECSVQRRHQKVLEESPSPSVDATLRAAMAEAARKVAASVGYTNAGTIEFLLDEDGRFYFLEMNTRLQVEHPITEAVTGVDLVHWQFRLADGERLTLTTGETLSPRGHAIEARIYAEDPDTGFMPSPGRILHLRPPSGPGVRDDGGYDALGEVPIFYDSLVSKLIAWAETRDQAIARLRRALGEYEVAGIRTTLPFFRWLLEDQHFLEGNVDTTFLDRTLACRNGQPFATPTASAEDAAAIAAALHLNGAGPQAASRLVSAWTRGARLEALR